MLIHGPRIPDFVDKNYEILKNYNLNLQLRTWAFEQPFRLQVPGLHSSLLTFSKYIFYLHLVLVDNAIIFLY